jgi:hypothetical protein
VTSGGSGSVWRRFEHDPRDPRYAGMRASDRDRAVVQEVITEAYAEGRLDREELDERTAAIDKAKTYADLVPPIRDLTFDNVPARFAPARDGDIERAAKLYYGERLRDAFFGFLVPNLICWAIWFMTGHDVFIWPIFVSIPTGLNLLRVATSRASIIESRMQKLERRQTKEVEEGKDANEQGSPSEDDTTRSESQSNLSEDHQKPEDA